MQKFFVTQEGNTIAENLTKPQAIKKAREAAIKNNGGNIGIGRRTFQKSISGYVLLHWTVYLD